MTAKSKPDRFERKADQLWDEAIGRGSSEFIARALRAEFRRGQKKMQVRAAAEAAGWSGPENTLENSAIVSSVCKSIKAGVAALEIEKE